MIGRTQTSIWQRFNDYLGQAIDGASLAMFRICFGAIVVWQAIDYLTPSTKTGLTNIYRYFIEAPWNVPYVGFEWVKPLPPALMYAVFIAMLISGVLIAIGLFARSAAAIFCLLFTYSFLLDATRYLNHYYFMCLLAFLLIWMPATNCFSVRAWLRRRRGLAVDPQGQLIPFWPVFLLRAQMFILYFYAGIAKLNPDWISGRPVWSTAQKFQNSIAQFLGAEKAEAFRVLIDYQMLAQAIALGGLMFDLAIPFLLIIRRTRILAIILVACFHGFNNQAFNIGVFPTLAFAGTLIFFDVCWPRRVWSWIRRPHFVRPHLGWLFGGMVAVPLVGMTLGWRFRSSAPAEGRPIFRLTRVVLAFVILWTSFHVVWPFRHYAISGDAQWTEEGHYFAWRMMLRSKTGITRFKVYDPQLFYTDAGGSMQVNWDYWTRQHPKQLHVHINACDFQWRDLPPVVVIFEPLIGERIILNHLSAQAGDSEPLCTMVEEQWKQLYGHDARWVETSSLVQSTGQIIEGISRLLASPGAKFDALVAQAMIDLEELRNQIPTSIAEREQRAVALNDVFAYLLTIPKCAPIVQQWLAETHPFELQGRLEAGSGFKIIDDSSLISMQPNHCGKIDRNQWRGDCDVYLDAKRLKINNLQSLPRAMLLFDNGRPELVWNSRAELRSFQLLKVESRAYMIHQYAQHIAAEWEKGFGRRPQVYVDSMVALNNRPFFPYIDPTLDLAAVPLRTFRTNAWIMPFPSDLPPDARPIERSTFDGQQVTATKHPNGYKWTEETVASRDGHRWTTAKVWSTNGQLSMTARYRDGVKHGAAEQYYDNGQIAVQVNYADGIRQGLATMWYMDGTKSWEGTYADGQLNGVAQGWKGDGQVAETAAFAGGQQVSADGNTADVKPVSFEEQAVSSGGGVFQR